MTTQEALAYLTQLANDHVRSLPQSSAMLVAQYTQQCVETLAQAIEPPAEKETGRKLRPVEDAAPSSS